MKLKPRECQVLKESYKGKEPKSIAKEILSYLYDSLTEENFSYYRLAINTFGYLHELKRNNILPEEIFKKVIAEVDFQFDDLITHSVVQMYKDGDLDTYLKATENRNDS